MTVRAGGGALVELLGLCPSTDAEPLLQLLLQTPGATVDWRNCEGAHTAVIQVLMAATPKLLGPPANAHLEAWVAPALTSTDAAPVSPGGVS